MNTKKVVVRYKLKADRVEENERFVKAVYLQLHERQPEGIQYATYKLSDGVSFVHILEYTTEAAHERFTSLPAFQNFQAQARDRFEESPLVSDAEEIGSY
jgi:quinol monooxygenase YgiN